MYKDFINELYHAPLAISARDLTSYLPLIQKVLTHSDIKDEKKPLRLALFDEMANPLDINKEEETTQDSVAVIPMHGLLTQYGSWFSYGTVDYARMLTEAYADPSIKAVVLDVDGPGGTTNSIFPMEDALNRRNKPVITAITGQNYSAYYFISVLTDKIFAINRMAELGSIGVMARIENMDKFWKENKIEIIEIIPPESDWKNKAYNEAKNGKPGLLIQEELTPWAVHFQDTVKKNRPSLDLSVEGLLNGRTFFAYDAVNNGLIDGVKSFNDIIQEAFDFKNKELNQLFN